MRLKNLSSFVLFSCFVAPVWSQTPATPAVTAVGAAAASAGAVGGLSLVAVAPVAVSAALVVTSIAGNGLAGTTGSY